MTTCTKPQPPGWTACTRAEGHPGPCNPSMDAGWFGEQGPRLGRPGFPWDVFLVGMTFGAFVTTLVFLGVLVELGVF